MKKFQFSWKCLCFVGGRTNEQWACVITKRRIDFLFIFCSRSCTSCEHIYVPQLHKLTSNLDNSNELKSLQNTPFTPLPSPSRKQFILKLPIRSDRLIGNRKYFSVSYANFEGFIPAVVDTFSSTQSAGKNLIITNSNAIFLLFFSDIRT